MCSKNKHKERWPSKKIMQTILTHIWPANPKGKILFIHQTNFQQFWSIFYGLSRIKLPLGQFQTSFFSCARYFCCYFLCVSHKIELSFRVSGTHDQCFMFAIITDWNAWTKSNLYKMKKKIGVIFLFLIIWFLVMVTKWWWISLRCPQCLFAR